jgi:multimeric flavodoxin WrbA
MKVIAINGSPRPQGNTSILIRKVFDVLSKEGIQTELLQLGGHAVRGCRACYRCYETKNTKCNIDDDLINALVEKMASADGIILGSPTYVTDVTTEMKALIDRATLISRANGEMFRRKVGAAVVAVRRAGATHVFDTMNHFFTINQMIVASSNYWNMGFGREPGQVESDEEGLKTMQVLGENVAWLVKKLAA